jgi:hypothetical protein
MSSRCQRRSVSGVTSDEAAFPSRTESLQYRKDHSFLRLQLWTVNLTAEDGYFLAEDQ